MALLQTPICDFGADFLDFELKDPDGVAHKGAQLAGPNGLLVAFICNHCPYVIAIADRLAADAKLLQEQGFGVVAIMSNDYRTYSADSPENMKLFAEKYGFTFHFLDTLPYTDKDEAIVGRPDPLIVGSSHDVIGRSDHILGKSLHPEQRKKRKK